MYVGVIIKYLFPLKYAFMHWTEPKYLDNVGVWIIEVQIIEVGLYADKPAQVHFLTILFRMPDLLTVRTFVKHSLSTYLFNLFRTT